MSFMRLSPSDVPPGTPGFGQRVSADPADTIRDVFLANRGRLTARQTEALIGRLTFTYGGEVDKAWDDLLASGMWERDGEFYVCPTQEAMAARGLI